MKTTLSSALLLGVLPLLGPPPADVEWPAYANDAGGSHYSTAAQIDRQNVSHLQVAWTYQYVVISAGGHGKNGTKMGDSVVAYALP